MFILFPTASSATRSLSVGTSRGMLLLLLAAALVCGAPQRNARGTVATARLQDHVRISHDTYYLGERDHPTEAGVRVHGYAFLNLHRNVMQSVSRTPDFPRPDKALHFNRSVKAVVAPGHCSGPIADGAAWRETRGYYLHTMNRNGLGQGFIIDAIQRANDEWRCALNAYRKLVAGPLIAVIDGSDGDTINLVQPDGRNEIGFASVEGRPGTVAVTIVWGIFGGPIADRRITEYDMVFDGLHYDWGDGQANSRVMDLQAIATHETGHSLGLDDVYNSFCSSETMFGTSNEGETKKRSIENTDINGLAALYGP